MCPISAWFSSVAISMLRTGFLRNSDSCFWGEHQCFAMDVRPNSITRPHRRSTVVLDRPFKPSVVAYHPFTQRRRHISVQSSRWWRSLRWRMACRKSNFASFRNLRVRITLHEPRCMYRKGTLTWAWWLHVILVVVMGTSCVGMGKWHSREWQNQKISV